MLPYLAITVGKIFSWMGETQRILRMFQGWGLTSVLVAVAAGEFVLLFTAY